MQPIVDGLQAGSTGVTFRYLNARDGADGQAAFERLNLPGHPSFVVFDASGAETFRAFGIVAESDLRDALAGVD